MRRFLVMMAVCLAFAAPLAFAQTAPTPRHIAAGRDALQAIFVDSGALSQGSLRAFTLLAPQFRQQISSAPFFAALAPPRQQALLTYVDGIGPIGQEEAVRGAPALLDNFAPRMAALFNEAELNDITSFMHTPEGQSYFLRSVLEGVQSEVAGQTAVASAPSDAELTALARFSQTAGGLAFNARAVELGALLRELGQQSTSAPHISARLQRDMCAILREQCPAGWRGQ